jgi:hypothetical protein
LNCCILVQGVAEVLLELGRECIFFQNEIGTFLCKQRICE